MKLRGHDMRHPLSGDGPIDRPDDSGAPAGKTGAGGNLRRVGDQGRGAGSHSQRRRATKGVLSRTATPGGELTLASDDGTLSFRLRWLDGQVHMERTRRSARSSAVVQVSHFGDEASFNRWCDSDRLRFAHPLLFAMLRRGGRALFHTAD